MTLYWNTPTDGTNFETSDEYRKERNIRDFAMDVTRSLDSMDTHLETIANNLGNIVPAINQSQLDISAPLNMIAAAVGSDSEGQTILEKAYAAVVVREHQQTVKKLRQALAASEGAEEEDARGFRDLREAVQAILGDE